MIKKTNSFSLIELLLAASIFSVVAIAAYSAFYNGKLAWDRLKSAANMQQQARSALDVMFTDLNNYLPSGYIKLQGSIDSLSFFAVCAGRRLNRISYYTESNTLFRKAEGLRDVLAEAIEDRQTEPVIQRIASSVEAIEFRYYCRTEGKEPEWLGSLNLLDDAELLGVEAKIAFGDDVEFSRKIVIYAKGIDGPKDAG